MLARVIVALLVALMLRTLAAKETRPVDVNKASLADLVCLPGIGPKRAEAILAYRDKRLFKSPTDLLRVKGISPKLFARLRPFVLVGTGTTPTPQAPPPPAAAAPQS